MNVAELKSILKYGGMSPLKLNMKIISPLGSYRYDEMLDVDYASLTPDGELILTGRQPDKHNWPTRCRELLGEIERGDYPDQAPVVLRAAEKMLARRLMLKPDEMIYEVKVTSLKSGPWNTVLIAETRETN